MSPLLLSLDDPPPFTLLRDDEQAFGSPFVLCCDHAGRRIPRALGDLGVAAADLERHIAWDIGAAGVTRHLSEKLAAFAILQTYSRLVYDCNRPPAAEDAVATVSEHTRIPGNEGVTAEERERRRNEIFYPYQNALASVLAEREARGLLSVLVSVHSFTPVFKGNARPFHAGVLHNRDPRFGHAMLALLREDETLVVGDNEPYALNDRSDYTVPTHGEKRGILHVELEIRQDLIADDAGQAAWASILARHLPEALLRLPAPGTPVRNPAS
jgi:predicted N-formylglutamate amidohydrolase